MFQLISEKIKPLFNLGKDEKTKLTQSAQPQIKLYQKICCQILKYGQLPNHIAFIMDGNRRYASQLGVKKLQGHEMGLDALLKSLEWCLNLGIQIVTVYAFSIQNFNREQNEVEYLMNLAKINLRKISNEGEFLDYHQIKVNVCGNLNLLKQDVRLAMKQIEDLTQKNDKLTLNICFAYNSTFQLDNAADNIKRDYQRKLIGLQDINHKLFQNNLLVQDPPDIVVRTSKEIRLSNFLTFQSVNSQIYFLQEKWPEISIFSLSQIILSFQMTHKKQKKSNLELEEQNDCSVKDKAKTK